MFILISADIVVEYCVRIIPPFLILFAHSIYLYDIFKNRTKPRLLSWIGWAILIGISVLSQYLEKGWDLNFLGVIASSLGCLAIAVFSFFRKNFIVEKEDWRYLVWGFLCCLVYLFSSSAWATTIFAVLADFCLGIPTLLNAFYHPLKEKSFAWIIFSLAWAINCLGGMKDDILFQIFPIYLLIFSFSMLGLTYRKVSDGIDLQK